MTDLMSVLHPATPPEPRNARLVKGYISTPDPDENVIADEKRLHKLRLNQQSKLRAKQRRQARVDAMNKLSNAMDKGAKV